MSQATSPNPGYESQVSSQSQSRAENPADESSADESCVTGCVEDYPITSAIVTLAAGIGAGFCIGAMLRGSSTSRSAESMASRLGHQLMDSMSSVIPDYFNRS